MSATTVPSRPILNVLGHYTVRAQDRVLVGRRIDGTVFVYDYPADGRGRRYFVESGFQSKAELALLLADYRRRAERLGCCPMSAAAVQRTLELALG